MTDQTAPPRVDELRLTFWGVRGTRPVCGADNVRYGGHTACVSLRMPDDDLFIFDAGSGLSELSDRLSQNRTAGRLTLLISHPHLDHIVGFPFFGPLYETGREIEICGASTGGVTTRDVLAGLIDGVRFPITFEELGARVAFTELTQGRHTIAGVEVHTLELDHRGTCLGYRVVHKGRSCCYITDNELFLPSAPQYDARRVTRLVEFVRNTDILIIDTTHSDHDYPAKVGQGHSCVGQVCDLAHAARAKSLYLFHHDPAQTDRDIDVKVKAATARLDALGSTTRCVAPAEGDVVCF